MLLSEQISKIDHRLSAVLASSESAFQRYLTAEFGDIKEAWGVSVPRGFKTSFAKTLDDIAQRRSLVALRESASNKIGNILRTLDAIEHGISSILRVDSPKFADEVAREIALDDEEMKCLSDEDFVSLLDKGRKIDNESKRLVYYLHIVRAISCAMNKAHDRIAKLSERIKFDSGTESAAAVALKTKIASVEQVLWRRRETVARLFFRQRRKLLARVVSATAVFDLCWKAPSDTLASLVKEKEVEIETPVRLLSEMDAAHRHVPVVSMKAAKRMMK